MFSGSILAQIAVFFVLILAANYFILQPKGENRLKSSLLMSGTAAIVYGLFIWWWGG